MQVYDDLVYSTCFIIFFHYSILFLFYPGVLEAKSDGSLYVACLRTSLVLLLFLEDEHTGCSYTPPKIHFLSILL